jgi:hypothetical protein
LPDIFAATTRGCTRTLLRELLIDDYSPQRRKVRKEKNKVAENENIILFSLSFALFAPLR